MLEPHSISTALAALEASPLSRRKAMLLVLLIDAAIDAARPHGDDVLGYRDSITDTALALVMELAAMRPDGPRLALADVAAEGPLSEAQYMVSRYNGGAVPCLVIRHGETQEAALPLLRRAVAALAGT